MAIARMTDIDPSPKDEPFTFAYLNEPCVELEKALEPIVPLINSMQYYTKKAKKNCHFPSEDGLTKDESAAIYLYTMDWDNGVFYKTLNRTLCAIDRSALKPWFLYLKLLSCAFNKLPNVTQKVWRGINKDISQKYHEGRKLTWCAVSSCSPNENIAKSFLGSKSWLFGSVYGTLFSIEAVNGKDIANYSRFPTEEEIVLVPGTRLFVISNTVDDSTSDLHYVHLREIDSGMKSISTTSILLKSTQKHKLTLPEGVEYEGEVLNGQPHGYGVAVHPFYGLYDGEWRNGKKHGHGRLTGSDRTLYMGAYENGERSGQGMFTWPNGMLYHGTWKNNQINGPGKLYDDVGRLQFEGEWTNNSMNDSTESERKTISMENNEDETFSDKGLACILN